MRENKTGPTAGDDGLDKAAKPRKRAGLIVWLSMGVVLLLVGAVVVPNFLRARAGEQLMSCRANLKNYGTALEMYATDNQGAFPASPEKLVPNYFVSLPKCPKVDSVTYRTTFGSAAPMNSQKIASYYYIECHGENHRAVSITGNYPAYSSVQGLIERAPR